MSGLIEIYRAHFRAYAALQLQYRVALVIWLLGMIVEPLMYLVVWKAVAEAGGGQVGGYSGQDFAAYFLVMMLVNHATFSWIMHEFEWRIRHGEFSPKLLRPMHPIHGDIADNITYKTLTFAVMAPAAVVLGLVFSPAFHTTWWAVVAFVPALALAFGVRFVGEWALALAAFWTTRVAAINQMYFAALLFLSGRMAPLTLFPEPVQALAAALPFRWILSFPVELLLGRLTATEALVGFGMQTLWLGLSLGILAALWRVGLRRYTAVGA
jgi:ABC-2 type transport system permease protein